MTRSATVPSDRYGQVPPGIRRKRAWWIGISAGVIVLALIIAWFVSTDVLGIGPKASARDIGFSIVDDHHVTVEIEVTATPQREVACALKALNSTFVVVGWKVVIYEASPERVRNFTESINTLELATTGLVANCWLT